MSLIGTRTPLVRRSTPPSCPKKHRKEARREWREWLGAMVCRGSIHIPPQKRGALWSYAFRFPITVHDRRSKSRHIFASITSLLLDERNHLFEDFSFGWFSTWRVGDRHFHSKCCEFVILNDLSSECSTNFLSYFIIRQVKKIWWKVGKVLGSRLFFIMFHSTSSSEYFIIRFLFFPWEVIIVEASCCASWDTGRSSLTPQQPLLGLAQGWTFFDVLRPCVLVESPI